MSARAWSTKAGLGPNHLQQFIDGDENRSITIGSLEALAHAIGKGAEYFIVNETTRSDAASANAFGKDHLPGLLGLDFKAFGEGWVEAEVKVRKSLMAPNGFLHAGTVVTLADTACGYGCIRALPEGANGFTTIELKTNFLGTAREGIIAVRADAMHLGRTTQIWDATVRHLETGKTIALFRCTQMVLWPKS